MPDTPEAKSVAPIVAVSVAATHELIRRSQGQRRVNLLWEYTQAGIAAGVTVTVLGCTAWLVLASTEGLKNAALSFLVGIANLVIGFYFGRTNHERTGGVPPTQYEGSDRASTVS